MGRGRRRGAGRFDRAARPMDKGDSTKTARAFFPTRFLSFFFFWSCPTYRPQLRAFGGGSGRGRGRVRAASDVVWAWASGPSLTL